MKVGLPFKKKTKYFSMWKFVYLYICVELNILIHDTEQEGQRRIPQDDVDHVWKTGPPDTHPAKKTSRD